MRTPILDPRNRGWEPGQLACLQLGKRVRKCPLGQLGSGGLKATGTDPPPSLCRGRHKLHRAGGDGPAGVRPPQRRGLFWQLPQVQGGEGGPLSQPQPPQSQRPLLYSAADTATPEPAASQLWAPCVQPPEVPCWCRNPPIFCPPRNDRLWICMEYCGGGSLQEIYHGECWVPSGPGGGGQELEAWVPSGSGICPGALPSPRMEPGRPGVL